MNWLRDNKRIFAIIVLTVMVMPFTTSVFGLIGAFATIVGGCVLAAIPVGEERASQREKSRTFTDY
ncbi:hypothetical protein [Natronoglycomyces albus]|uniref:Uncharacterized protein n=1 Tax=Natronoglycomyces albus TaxID=2811108 RepID=A0A895XV85_9ACTN|nr:hypothetical protein [Natronoglycomyces albus]QSB06436.1 hypothetical protein JQS30_05905 [Natronoglycomyces albus]